MPGLLITATDTEVGKTAVTCGLALALRRRGLDVGVMKPVASGCRDAAGDVSLEDAEQLRAAAGVADDLGLVCPVALPEPLSPHLAAERANQSVERDAIIAAYRELSTRHDLLLVEGVGGLLVPLRPDWLLADLAGELGLPLVIVTRWGLGTFNHTLLTVSEARRRNLAIAGLVVNEVGKRPHGVAEQTAPRELRRLTGETILAQVPFVEAPGPAERFEQIAEYLSRPAQDHLLRRMDLEPPDGFGLHPRFGVDSPTLPDRPGPDSVPV